MWADTALNTRAAASPGRWLQLMKRYTVNLRSELSMILLFLLIAAAVLTEILFFRKTISALLLFVILGGTIFFGVYFSRKLTLAKTLWTFTEEGFTITWLTKLKFQVHNDIIVNWHEVKNYKDNYGDGYSVFVINLIDGRRLRFPYGGLFMKDDSAKLQEAFHIFYLRAVHPDQIPKGYNLKKDFGLQ